MSMEATYASGALGIARSMGPGASPSIQGWSDNYLTSAEHVYKRLMAQGFERPIGKPHDEKGQSYYLV